MVFRPSQVERIRAAALAVRRAQLDRADRQVRARAWAVLQRCLANASPEECRAARWGGDRA